MAATPRVRLGGSGTEVTALGLGSATIRGLFRLTQQLLHPLDTNN